MARLPAVNREQLSPEDQATYDRIAAVRGRVPVTFSMLLYSPKLAACVTETGDHVRFTSLIPPDLREVVILAVGWELKAQYEFTVHVRLAREAGVTEATIDALKHGRDPEDPSSDEALVVRYTRELLRDRKVSDATFNAVVDRFGTQGAVDLTGVVGHYLFIAQFLFAFEVELAPGVEPELPV